MAGYGEKRLMKPPLDLDATAAALLVPSEWSDAVLKRIASIGFSVPDYINHPMANIIRHLTPPPQTEARS
jgi:hypothetical protein